jgi:drug/metabolite transporter (DMT)-like permease
VRDVPPTALVFARTGIGAAILLPIAWHRGALKPLFSRWGPLLLFTMVEVALPWLLLSRAETRISSSLAGLLVAAVPLVGVAIARLMGDTERIDSSRLVGLLLGIAGVAALLGLDFGNVDGLAVLEVAGVVVGYALGPAILARTLSDLPSIGVVTASLLITAAIYLPFAVLDPPHRLTAQSIASVIVLATVCTALAFVLFFALIAGIGPARATVITYVNPAVAVLLGVVVLGESVTTGMIVGFPLILAGSFLAARRRAEVVEEPELVPTSGAECR